MLVTTKQKAVFFSESDRQLFRFLESAKSFETAQKFLSAIAHKAGQHKVPIKIDITEADIQSIRHLSLLMNIWANEIADQLSDKLLKSNQQKGAIKNGKSGK